MFSPSKIPDLLGYLVLTEFGAVLESDGELKNDERCANIITSIIHLTDNVDPQIFTRSEIQKISIVFEQHSYTICLSNKKIYVVKRSTNQSRATNNNNQRPSPSSSIIQSDSTNTSTDSQQPQNNSGSGWVESA